MDSYKKIEELLYEYPSSKVKLKNIELDINDIRGIANISYDEKVGKTNKVNSIVENEVINREEKITQLERMRNKENIKIQKIENVLTLLNEEEYKLIELRYFKKYTFKDIGMMLNNSDIYLIQKRKKIINKMIPLLSDI